MDNKCWKCFYHNKDKVLFAKYDFGQVVISDGENCIFRRLIDNVTGIAYFDGKLVVSIEDRNKLLYIDEKHDDPKEVIIDEYCSVEIIKMVTGHDSLAVLRGIGDKSNEYFIFDLVNSIKIAVLPFECGFIDLAYKSAGNALLLCETEQEVPVRYVDEVPDTEVIFFAGVSWNNDCQQVEITDSIKLYIDNNYNVPNKLLYSGDLRFPLFDQYLYHWLKQKSFSLNGRYVVYYSEDIKGVIIGNPIGGEIHRIISLPDELANSSNDFVYNYYTQELFVITNDNDIRRLYICVKSEKAIDKLNAAYNKAYINKVNLAKMRSEGDLDFTNILFSAITSCTCEVVANENEQYSKMLEHISDISTKLSRIDQNVIETNERTKKMEILLNSILEIQKTISSEKSKLGCLKVGEDDEEYMKFFDSIAQRMNKALYQSGNACVDAEEATLKGLYGKYWDRLDEFTKKALVSARVFLANCGSTSYGGLDYSGVCISTCSALEQELKLRFFTGYKAYLRQKFQSDYSKWPKSMKYEERTENNTFSIGKLPAIFGSKQRNEKTGERQYNSKMGVSDYERNLLNDYIKTIVDVEGKDIEAFFERDSFGLSILDRCEDVRCMYRNAAAHTEALSIETAKECCRDVIGVSRVDAAQKVGQVQGLIYDLVRLTKLPDIKE